MNSTDLPALVRTQDGGVIARPNHWTFFFGDLRFPLPRVFIEVSVIWSVHPPVLLPTETQ